MKNIINTTVVIMGTLFLSGCVTGVDYQFDYPGDKIVLLGQLSPQNGAIVYLQESALPDEVVNAADKLISSATVELMVSGEVVATLNNEGEGKYASVDYSIDPELTYSVKAYHPDYDTVFAGPVSVPVMPAITRNELTFEREEFRDGEFGGNATLDFAFQDEVGPSYYYLEAVAEVPRPFQFQVDFFSEYDFDLCDIQNYHPPFGIFWTDLCFEGEEFSAQPTFEVTPFIVNSSIDDRMDYTHYVIRLRSLGYEAFRYLNDKKNPDDGLTVVEVPASYTNVANGFGVLMAYQEVSWRRAK
ncbi:MAG: DUF4249 family protein [Lewinella sp.]